MIPPEANGVGFRKLAVGSELIQARQLHGQVYIDCGYVDSLTEWGAIDDEYVQRSVYWGAVTDDSEVAGTVRQIRCGSSIDVPTATSVPLTGAGRDFLATLEPTQVVEISALAVDKAHWSQAFAISAGLYRCMYQEFIRTRRPTHWLAIMDTRLLGILTEIFHFPFEPLGPETWFMGSQSRPVHVDARHAFTTVWNADPGLREYFLNGMSRHIWNDLAPLKP